MTITRWTPRSSLFDPLERLAEVRDEMNRMFHPAARTVGEDGGFLPPLDLIEEGDTLWVSVDLPGVRKEDVNVSLQDQYLTIKGTRQPEAAKKEATFYHRERVTGPFLRTVELPFAVNAAKIDAQFRDGVLQVTLPKADEAKPRQIEVKIG